MTTTHSVFVGSFNAAGGDSDGLSKAEAAVWLGESEGADIVVLGFQEYGPQPAAVFPPPRNNPNKCEYLRALAPTTEEAAEEAATQAALDAALGSGGGGSSRRVRVADISMGEVPACRAGPTMAMAPLPPGHDVRDSTPAAPAEQFYGFLRLQVYMQRELAEAHGMLPAQGAGASGAVETFIVPDGSKKTSVQAPGATAVDVVEGRAVADGFQYMDGSPDKGGVAVRLRFAAPDGTRGGDGEGGKGRSLLLMCCHLAGTNKYCMPEAFFERTRLRQLKKAFAVVGDGSGEVSAAAGASAGVGAAGGGAWCEPAVLFGDLNFRNEVYREGPRKAKGGDDWTAVDALLQGEGGAAAGGGTGGAALAAAVATFGQCDRLRKHLDGTTAAGGGATAAAAPAAAVAPVAAAGGEEAAVADAADLAEPTEEELAVLRGFTCTLVEKMRRVAASGVSAHNVHPSFTYKLGEAHPRKFNTKRTPSWPDRVLMRCGSCGSGLELPPLAELADDAFECGVKRDVLCSDHEPVFARFALKLG